MYTRKQYMEDNSKAKGKDEREFLHREYYGQFVDEYVIDVVAAQIGRDTLLNRTSDDPHLNDISLHKWDKVWLGDAALRKICGANEGGGYSLSDVVCTAKEAARQFILAAELESNHVQG
jgi:hypothetical protein